jgi:hypothetical protein
MLKKAIISQIQYGVATEQYITNIKVLLEVIKEVHKVKSPLKKCIYQFIK